MSNPMKLPPKQLAVARLIVAGHSHKTIAGMLDISESTVRNHLAAVNEKLGVTRRTELLALFAAGGFDWNDSREVPPPKGIYFEACFLQQTQAARGWIKWPSAIVLEDGTLFCMLTHARWHPELQYFWRHQKDVPQTI